MKHLIRALSTERFQPQPAYVPGEGENRDHYAINQRILASLVGVIAFCLPCLMLGVAWARHICFRDSLSHFFYDPFLGLVFVAALAAIATFLVAYRGQNVWENRLATFAGLAALGVAIFPTAGHGCRNVGAFASRAVVALPAQAEGGPEVPLEHAIISFQLFPYVAAVHYACAAILFGFLAWYCFMVFPRVIPPLQEKGDGALRPAKATRNLLYFLSGAVILLAALAMALHGAAERLFGWDPEWWEANNATFWCEAAALWAFGVSWIVKGRLFGLVLKDPGE